MIVKRLGKIAIGCFGIIVILIILGIIFSGVIIKKLISGAIQQKTGVSVNVNDVNNGKLSYTDPKTGQTLDIGTNKIPDSFPKDFPIYPGSTVTTSLSGNQEGQGNGFWLTLTTKDGVDKVSSFYETDLKTNGWTASSTTGAGTTWVVSKADLTGYLTVTNSNNLTSILIVLGKGSPNPTTSASSGQ